MIAYRSLRVLFTFVIAVMFAVPAAGQSTPPAKPGWITDKSAGCSIWFPTIKKEETFKWTGPSCPDGKVHGEGSHQSYLSGKLIESYVGSYWEGRMHGNGILKMIPSGQRYKGAFTDGQITGEGEYFWANGNLYKGSFAKARLDGQGTYTWKNGNSYEGHFVKDKFPRKGIYKWGIESPWSGNFYEGEFEDHALHGQGDYVWQGKARIRVEWKKGVPRFLRRANDTNDHRSEKASGLTFSTVLADTLKILQLPSGSSWYDEYKNRRQAAFQALPQLLSVLINVMMNSGDYKALGLEPKDAAKKMFDAITTLANIFKTGATAKTRMATLSSLVILTGGKNRTNCSPELRKLFSNAIPDVYEVRKIVCELGRNTFQHVIQRGDRNVRPGAFFMLSKTYDHMLGFPLQAHAEGQNSKKLLKAANEAAVGVILQLKHSWNLREKLRRRIPAEAFPPLFCPIATKLGQLQQLQGYASENVRNKAQSMLQGWQGAGFPDCPPAN